MTETQKILSQTDFTVTHRDNGIIVYRLENLRRTTLDSWSETFKKDEQTAITEKRHLRRLMDVRGVGFPTPYGITKAMENVSEDPEGLRESYAILVDNSMTAQVLSNALRHLNKWLHNTRLFTDEHTALDWLDERLAELGE
jgi:hypothetical protein